MTSLIGACLAAATLLFVVSLPFGPSPAGAALRRWAGALFLAALAPSLACGLFAQATGRGGGQLPSILEILAGIGVLAIIAAAAYITLVVRGYLRPGRHRSQAGAPERRGYRYDDEPRGGVWERRE